MSDKSNKNTILCIETTSNICGASLVVDNKIVYENNLDTGLTHSVTLFNNIEDALNNSNIDIKDISQINVSSGPGSFTGIRIGIAAAVGLAEMYNTKISYIDTLDSLAYNLMASKDKNNYILSMIDARVDRVYISLYNGETLEKLSKDTIITIDELCQILNKDFIDKMVSFSLVGSGAVNYKNTFKELLKINYKILDKESNLKASSLAFANGQISKMPIINYLLASKAEREKNGNN